MRPGLYVDADGNPVVVQHVPAAERQYREEHLTVGTDETGVGWSDDTATPAVLVPAADLDAVLQHAYEVRGGSVDRWPEYAALKALLDARLKEQTP